MTLASMAPGESFTYRDPASGRRLEFVRLGADGLRFPIGSLDGDQIIAPYKIVVWLESSPIEVPETWTAAQVARHYFGEPS